MAQDIVRPVVRGRHLLSAEQLAATVGTTTDQLTRGHRRGNGVRVNAIYFVVVSIVAMALLAAAIVVASRTM